METSYCFNVENDFIRTLGNNHFEIKLKPYTPRLSTNILFKKFVCLQGWFLSGKYSQS